jgi:hypothetical protein
MSVAFSAFYASYIPKMCKNILLNESMLKKYINISKIEWAVFLRDHPRARMGGKSLDDEIESDVSHQGNKARYSSEQDKAAIADFCSEVLKAFGPNGRVLPDLIRSTQGRA